MFFMFAGEASAGKSSLLNLLLGEEILPSHVLPCTSAITVIKYGESRHANVIYRNGKHTDIPTLDEEGLKQLHTVAFIKSDAIKSSEDVYQKRREGHDIVEIQVFLPLTFLEVKIIPLLFRSKNNCIFVNSNFYSQIRHRNICLFNSVMMKQDQWLIIAVAYIYQ